MELRQGHRFERYEVVGRVGSGGMAQVYQARHLRLGSLHAVKVLRLPTPAVIDRLLKEGRAQSALSHPNVVAVTDVIDVGGAPGLVMEWVDGPTLRALCKARRLSLAEVDDVARGLMAGIGEAHAHGWVHRDLKPANVLMARSGDRLVPKITDFGLVKALTGSLSDDGGPATRTGAMMGTPAYMAPEQTVDAASVDHRADLFALGAVLYELLSGRKAFDGRDAWALLEQVRAESSPLLSELEPSVPPAWVQVVHACLRCDPQQRPVDVQTVARAWAEGAVTASGWSIDTVGEAERLAPVPESVGLGAPPLDPAGDTVSIGSDETFGSWGLETSGAPTTEVPPSPTVEEPSPVPQEEQPTRWSARVAAVAVMVGGLGLAAWTVGWPEGAVVEVPRVEVLTVDEVPAVSDDPAQQEAMERGWAALLEGDVDGALRRLTVAAQAEHPLPALLRSYALMRGGDLAGSLSATRDVRRRWEGADGATGSLLSVVAAQQDQGRIDVPEVGAHRQAWPDDLYGRLMEADYCAMIDRAACEAAVPALLERAPTAPLAWQVAAEAWMELGDASRALSVVDRGLAVSPLDPTLLTFRAQLQLGADDLQAARVTLRQLVEVSPGQLTPKLLRVKLATLADDRALLEALSAELTSLSQPASVRRAFHEAHADCLEGLGRAREADAALARAEDDAMASGAVEEAYLLRLRRRSVAIRASWHEQAAEHLEAARTMASRSPEIPDVQRNRLMSMTMVDEALAQVRAGRLSEAETLLRRMEVGESIPPGALDRVRRELAVQRGDVPAIRASMASVWDGEATLRALLVGALTRAGRPELALEALSEGEPVAWRLHTEQRQLAVGLAVSEAEARLAVGDDPTDAVQRAQRLWPSPDPDHGLAMRLASLSEAISAR